MNKEELFDYLIAKCNLQTERRPNGNSILSCNLRRDNEQDKLILDAYHAHKSKKTREQRYADYLKLKDEFENGEK